MWGENKIICVVDQIKPPPSCGFWFDTLHLWPTIRPHGDPPLPLHPWWGKDFIPWCCLKCVYIDCKRCKVSCLVGVNPSSSITFFLVFSSIGWHCYVGWWHLHIGDVIIVDPIQTNLVSQVVFFSWGDCDSGDWSERRTLSW
jgi:hypothetical protein